MNSFIYDIKTKVYFGENQLGNLGSEVKKYGNKVLLTYGGGSIKKIGLYDKVITELKKHNITVFELSGIEPNPRIESVNEGALLCKKNEVDVVLAVGGGSTIDCSKWICAGAYYDGDAWDFFSKGVEVKNAFPLLTVLTLSATGSEMDAGGVISNLKTNDKIGRIDAKLLPKVSFLDPTVTYTVNAYQTACGSADILSHVIETYFTTQNDLYMLDTFMEGLMKTVIKYTPVAINEPTNYEARANLMWASSWAINGFTNGGKVKAWSCHPLEHQLSAYYDITHGLGLAILTPRWLKYCLNEETLYKYVSFGVNVFNIDANLPPYEIANTAIDKLSQFLFETLNLTSSLSKLNINETYFEVMAKKACGAKGVINGFIPLNVESVIDIYKACL